MNKRQSKKLEKKKSLFYDTGQKSYRNARLFNRWFINQRTTKEITATPNYWGEY